MTGAVEFNFDLVKWELFITLFLLTVAFLIARGKSVKKAIAFFVVTFSLLLIEFFTKYLVLISIANPTKGIRIAITWVPTVLFVLTLAGSTMLGIWRGFRKSALLMLHSIGAAALCLILFFVCTRSEAVDKLLLKIVNAAVGGVYEKWGISPECVTLRDALAEWIPQTMGYGAELQIVLRDNGAYLLTLVDMVYRIVFAVVLYLLYLLLIFIMYIVYRCAYSETKYKIKKEKLVADNRTDRRYNPHRVYGGIVGLVRGIVSGIISLSMLGSVLFMAADIGKNNVYNADFGNSKIDYAYSIYQSIEDYGSYGIFKYLNSFADSDDQPYYLFAADLILSGRLRDDENGISANIKFRKEIGAYSKFMRQTIDLMLRYGGDDLRDALNGVGDMNTRTAALSIFGDKDFQAEFESLIDEFDAQTYFINFALSAATSLLANVDDTSFASSMNETNRELMKIMFKEGYLSDYIPDELAMKNSGKQTLQPHIGIAQLYEKSDSKVFYKVISSFFIGRPSGASGTVELMRSILPQLRELSIFKKDNKNLDAVMGRVYCFMANTYLKGSSSSAVRYSEVEKANVDWMKETNALLDVVEDGFTVY